jgi:hypothetical protein
MQFPCQSPSGGVPPPTGRLAWNPPYGVSHEDIPIVLCQRTFLNRGDTKLPAGENKIYTYSGLGLKDFLQQYLHIICLFI